MALQKVRHEILYSARGSDLMIDDFEDEVDASDAGSLRIIHEDDGRMTVAVRSPRSTMESKITVPLTDWLKLRAQPQADGEATLKIADELHELGFEAGWNGAVDECATLADRLKSFDPKSEKDYGKAIRAITRPTPTETVCDQVQDKDLPTAEDVRGILSVQAHKAAWRPIDSAPMDGTVIIAYWAPSVDDGSEAFDLTCWHEGDWRENEDMETVYAPPTHWMPLPAAPAASLIAHQENLHGSQPEPSVCDQTREAVDD